MDLVVVTTATIRPDILKQTYQSFSDNIIDIDFKKLKLFLNIDPLPKAKIGEIDAVVSVAESFFGEVILNTPERASYPRAVKWLWGKASNHQYIFDLQDDWVLNQEIKIIDAVRKITGRAKGVTLNSYNFKRWPDLLCMSPTIFTGEYIRKVVKHLKDDISPERYLRHITKHPLRIANHMIGYTAKYPSPETIIVSDIGREWMKNNKQKKHNPSGKFTTWEK